MRVVYELPGGGRILAFSRPPAHFDPTTAEDRLLLAYGYPRRPLRESALLAEWTDAVGRLGTYVEPKFGPRPRLGGSAPGPRPRSVTAGPETSDNWSGVVVHAPAGKTFKWVRGSWTMPKATWTGPNAANEISSWVGIDGDGSGDVLQAGVDTSILIDGDLTLVKHYAWIEWFPLSAKPVVESLPVEPGHQVDVLICGSGNRAEIFFSNLTLGIYTSFPIYAPDSTTLLGNSAEWIVERPSENGIRQQLPEYGTVIFDKALAGFTDETTVDAATGNTIAMLDDAGAVVSKGSILGPQRVRCRHSLHLPRPPHFPRPSSRDEAGVESAERGATPGAVDGW